MKHSQLPRWRVSVVIPAHNEAGVLRECVEETLAALSGLDAEVIIVNDGSTDTTGEIARALAAEYTRVGAIDLARNLGKGAALRHGFEASTGEVVIFLDADLEVHPRQVLRALDVMRQTGAKVVIASKHHPESRFHTLWVRRVISLGHYAVVRALFGLPLRDTQTGLKVFQREVLLKVVPRMKVTRFASDLELLVAAHRYGFEIAEIPVEVLQRSKDHRHIGPLAVVESALDTLRVYYWASFWHWLSPGIAARFWMLTFLVGLLAASVGGRGLLSETAIPWPFRGIVDVLTLRFIETARRDWLLVWTGLGATIVATIQLNKMILRAFARPDRGGLAGIASRHVEAGNPTVRKPEGGDSHIG